MTARWVIALIVFGVPVLVISGIWFWLDRSLRGTWTDMRLETCGGAGCQWQRYADYRLCTRCGDRDPVS